MMLQILLLALASLTLQTPAYTFFYQQQQNSTHHNFIAFSFSSSPSPSSSYSLQFQNIPSKGIRLRLCQPLFNSPFITFSDYTTLTQKGFKLNPCYGYNFWYQSPTNQTHILQQIQNYIHQQISKEITGKSHKIVVRKNDHYVVRLSEENRIQTISVVFDQDNVIQSSQKQRKKGRSEGVKYVEVNENRSIIFENNKIVEASGYYNRTLLGQGLHQTVTIRFPSLTFPLTPSCLLTLQQQTTDKFYLDSNQFTAILHHQTINIEKPSFHSKQYYAQLTLPLTQDQNGTLSASYPIHFRYQKPSTNQYAKTALTPLRSLKVRCEGREYVLKEEEEGLFFYSTNVPVGQVGDKSLVFVGTLVATFYAAMLIRKGMM